MPILKFLSYLKSHHPQSITSVPFKSYSGKVVAFDASDIIYNSFLNENIQRSRLRKSKDLEGNKNSHISTLMTRAILCKTHGIKPVWVFDGAIPIQKLQVEIERTKYGKALVNKIQSAISAGNTRKALELRKRNKTIKVPEIDNAMSLLEILGFPVIKAPAEALAQCAYLNKINVVDAVVTKDDNCFPLGGRVMIKQFKSAKKLTQITLTAFLESSTLTQDQFIDFCILCGCNYTTNITGIGPKTSLKLIQEFKGIEGISPQSNMKIWRQIQGNERFKPQRARELFKNPEVVPYEQGFQFREVDYVKLHEFLVSQRIKPKKIKRWIEKLRVCQ